MARGKQALEQEDTQDVEAEDAKKESKKTPVPEGFMAPVEFAKHCTEKFGEEVRPQVVYGYIRNGKEFPYEEREGTPKFIVKVDDGEEWVRARMEKRKERAAKKAAEAEAEAQGEEDA